MKWLFLFMAIGCLYNASSMARKSSEDEFEEDDTSVNVINIYNEEDDKYTPKERISWFIGGVIFLVLMFIFK